MKVAQTIEDYITLRRSTGTPFKTSAILLRAFGRTLGAADIDSVDEEAVLAFCNGSKKGKPISTGWHHKLYTLGGLFRFAKQRGLMSTSPMPQVIPKRPAYATPYIYTDDELRRLLDAAALLDIRNPKSGQGANVSALTFRTLLLLLYGAGLRVSEALGLTTDDVDLAASMLIVRNTKFFKTRLVPIGPKLSVTLRTYAVNRLPLAPRLPSTNAFFVNRRGGAISRQVVENLFPRIRGRAGIRRDDGAYFQPRLHDLRHSFAVHRLVAWYHQGADVQLLLPKLSTYMGHIGLAETQHYLTMTPDLLRSAGQRFEHYAAAESQP